MHHLLNQLIQLRKCTYYINSRNFQKSDPNANFMTPTKPSRSAGSNEDSMRENDMEHANEHVNGNANINGHVNGNARQVSDTSDRLSLKRSSTKYCSNNS